MFKMFHWPSLNHFTHHQHRLHHKCLRPPAKIKSLKVTEIFYWCAWCAEHIQKFGGFLKSSQFVVWPTNCVKPQQVSNEDRKWSECVRKDLLCFPGTMTVKMFHIQLTDESLADFIIKRLLVWFSDKILAKKKQGNSIHPLPSPASCFSQGGGLWLEALRNRIPTSNITAIHI